MASIHFRNAAQMRQVLSGIKARGRCRQPGKMTSVEKRFNEILETRQSLGEMVWFGFELVTFKLADDCRYTPDFVIMLADGELQVHETKGGFMREDSYIKLKVFAATFPLRVFLHQWTKKAGWKEREIA